MTKEERLLLTMIDEAAKAPSGKKTFNLVIVTPELALEILARNVSNRKLDPETVTAYARDMRDGRWRSDSHQGIALSSDGKDLVDGQHRLHAIVETGLTVQIDITVGVSADTKMIIDTHRRRNLAAQMQIKNPMSNVSINTVAVMRVMLGYRKMTPYEQETAYLKMAPSIEWTENLFGHTRQAGLGSAPVKGPVAAAHLNGVAPEKLAVFVHQLLTGLEADETVVKLRDYLKDNRGRLSRPSAENLYRRVERVLQAFIDGEKLLRISAREDRIFKVAA